MNSGLHPVLHSSFAKRRVTISLPYTTGPLQKMRTLPATPFFAGDFPAEVSLGDKHLGRVVITSALHERKVMSIVGKGQRFSPDPPIKWQRSQLRNYASPAGVSDDLVLILLLLQELDAARF